MLSRLQYSPSGRTGLTTGCNWSELKSKVEISVDSDVAEEDKDEEDDFTASLKSELSLTGDKDVVLLTTATVATVLAPRVWAL